MAVQNGGRPFVSRDARNLVIRKDASPACKYDSCDRLTSSVRDNLCDAASRRDSGSELPGDDPQYASQFEWFRISHRGQVMELSNYELVRYPSGQVGLMRLALNAQGIPSRGRATWSASSPASWMRRARCSRLLLRRADSRAAA